MNDGPRGHRQGMTAYDPDDRVDITGFSGSLATYAFALTALAGAVHARGGSPVRYPLGDLVAGGLATHKFTRLVSRSSVASPVRAPFTEFEGAAGAGEHVESARGERGVRHTVGELITCPFCLGVWVSTAYVAGLALAPRTTRAWAAVFAVTGVSDFLQHAYSRPARRLSVRGSRRREFRRPADETPPAPPRPAPPRPAPAAAGPGPPAGTGSPRRVLTAARAGGDRAGVIRRPHENVATVLVDPHVLHELEVHLMALDLRVWPVATAPICVDGARTAFQLRRRLLMARRGAWDDAAEWTPVWISFGDSWRQGDDPLPWAAHRVLWQALEQYAEHVRYRLGLGGVSPLEVPRERGA